MTKDEMKNRISMALKDSILQQSFEIICKENKELKSIADFQTSSNLDRFFQLKRSKEQLAKAKEIIKKLKALYLSPVVTKDDVKRQDEILAEVEQFLKAESTGCYLGAESRENLIAELKKQNKDLHDNYEQYKAVAEPEIAALKTTIAKLRNCMNCKYRDTKGHSSCKDKGIVLCSHWEMKE